MISLDQYFTDPTTKRVKPHTDEHEAAATDLLDRVEAVCDEFRAATGCGTEIDPDTGTEISGSRNGAGDGGFREQTAKTGTAKSKHKLAHAVDVYDPTNSLDRWLTDAVLEQHGLYREAPDATPGWCHLQDIAPGSGRRTFTP